ncbi:response regulator [Lujinxingia vulgaris]|uniref:histidine kinase n=1 Tax=Lujinxingia vulgaris TaxID=2600176 RepID=A0A5C6XBV6_9DELT|nr:response regulator [Lujinxingia vulgaris]TXD37197.1 response regulator [Lujinxingia vulgaris]
MNSDQLRNRLRHIFIGELQEQVARIRAELLDYDQLDQPARHESLQILFRAVHALKGAARAVDERAIERTCHRFEDELARLRASRSELPAALIDDFLSVSDALEHAAELLAAGQPVHDDLFTGAGAAAPPAPPSAEADAPERAATPDNASQPRPVSAFHRATVPSAMSERPPSAVLRALGASAADGPQHVRLSAPEIDRLVALGGELWSTHRRLERLSTELADRPERARDISTTLYEQSRRVSRLVEDLNERLQAARMQPLSLTYEVLARVAHDLRRAFPQRDFVLHCRGGDLRLDRDIIEGLSTALLQLLRNAVVHGIEPVEERVAAGKPARAAIHVEAHIQGDHLHIAFRDDGRGIDWEAVEAAALKLQLPEVTNADERVAMLFTPGLSTTGVSSHSGRGVGLDIVQSHLNHLRATIALSTEPDAGTAFFLQMPVSLATTEALVVTAAGQDLALPTTAIASLDRIHCADVELHDGKLFTTLGDQRTRLVHLNSLLSLPDPSETPTHLCVVELRSSSGRLALIVEDWHSVQTLVVKSLGRRLRGLKLLGGYAQLPHGEVALLLQPTELLARVAGAPASLQTSPAPTRAVLIVDDSVTTRTLYQRLLEDAGWRVLVASDGKQALELLNSARVEAVISDVEMPRLDGFELTRALRHNPTTRQLPIILVTARASDEDRALGLEAGADAYIVKNLLDPALLLQTLSDFLPAAPRS